MSSGWHTARIVVVAGLCAGGCTQPETDSGPTYAEAVVTYNAELEALDRLEAKREKLIRDFAAESTPKANGNALGTLEGLLASAEELQARSDGDGTADRNAQLDDVVERSLDAQEIAEGLLGGLLDDSSETPPTELTPEEQEEIALRKAEFEAELGQLDQEIVEQKARVERARKARDAAEAASVSP